MTEQKNKSPFLALSRMCLNNWHYVEHKILSFHKEINFFTGHSGSGKSTIIDAMQVVLYANTDGRGFFNKAAADDSDRSLIEYLRGMVNMEDNNESQYLRNQDFSSTIVLEFERSDTGEKQCVGVVFDVETDTNDYGRRYFFWHQGALLENEYRLERRVMSREEIKEYLVRNFEKGSYYVTSQNETFRRKLYDEYLGGLDREKFPRLFKRAIPFKMNSRIEEFVKEYICMEQNIHIEDMQESVIQYGRMQKRIADTAEEVSQLTKIHDQYQMWEDKKQEAAKYESFFAQADILWKKQKLRELSDKINFHRQDLEKLNETISQKEQEKQQLKARSEELLRMIADTGYDEAKAQLQSVNELLEHLERSQEEWDKIAKRLGEWAKSELASNEILWNVEKFQDASITEEEIENLRRAIAQLRESVGEEKEELSSELRELKRELKTVSGELSELHQGSKAYPRELLEARQYLCQKLSERNKKAVNVSILADLMDIKEERWRNAVEGYLGNNKLLLVVEPAYAREALELYQQMDKKKFCKVSVLDTEKIMAQEHPVKDGALAHMVKTSAGYVRRYLDFMLGSVITCDSVEELREHKIAVTDDCILYQGFRLQHMNPASYTRNAYIGVESLKRRISMLKKQKSTLEQKISPLLAEQSSLERLLSMEALEKPAEVYLKMQKDIRRMEKQKKEKERLKNRILEIQKKDAACLQQQRMEVETALEKTEQDIRYSIEQRTRQQDMLKAEENQSILLNQELTEQERTLKIDAEHEKEFQEIVAKEKRRSLEQIKRFYAGKQEVCQREGEQQFQNVAKERSDYLRNYPNRTFAPFAESNEAYDKLLNELQFQELERFQQLAAEQARAAVEHFKEDFIYKIRDAINDAMRRKDELNRIIARLDFGKDKYKFVFKRNSGEDGKYYDMFMDKDLEVNPSQLDNHMMNQMNMFTMGHENKYGALMNELISIFIPPVGAGEKEQEEARRNMEKYADYRTYLSFDMQQIIRGENDEPMKLKLSRMLKKNSGGEGQNPLYVALLASFAQAYRITLDNKIVRSPTIRLVVLDEAFSKMDAEKVASCISLIRSLGFQVIISATNDKIQNYLENVDKTFVFANPNKKNISIQEFERKDFEQLQIAD